MKALFRVVLAAIGVLGLLAVAVVIYATTFLDPNDLKPRLADAVRERTGLELSLNGPLSWTFYPRLGVTIEDATARLPDQPEETAPFAAFHRAEARIRFAPLLSGNIEVDGFTLNGLRLSLERDAQGRGNWETLTDTMARQDEISHGDTSSTRLPKRVSTAGDRPLAIDIASVQISDGQVHYVDEQSEQDVTLSQLALVATNVTADGDFPLDMSFALATSAPDMTGTVSLKSQAAFNLTNATYALHQLVMKGNVQWPVLNTDHNQSFSLEAELLAANLKDQHYRFDGAALSSMLYVPTLGDQALPVDAVASGQVSLEDDTATLDQFMLASGQQLRLTGSGQASNLGSDPDWQGNVEMKAGNLRSWLDQFGLLPETRDVQALQRIGFSSRVSGNRHVAHFDDLSLILDDDVLRGTMALGLDHPLLHADVSADRLDIDRYLPPRRAVAEETPAQQAQASSQVRDGATQTAADDNGQQTLVWPVHTLKDLDLALAISVKELHVGGMALEDAVLDAGGRNGRQQLKTLRASLYGGTLQASGVLDTNSTPAALAFSPVLDAVSLQPLLADAIGRNDLLRGTLDAQGNFQAELRPGEPLLAHLDGEGNFIVADGALIGTNLPGQLCSSVAILQGRESTRTWGSDTEFDRFSGSVTIEDGVVHNDDLNIAVPGIEMKGQGEIDLNAQELDIDLGAQLANTADIEGCPVSDILAQVRFPIHCSGSFKTAPGDWCRFDADTFGTMVGDMAASEGRERLRDQLQGDPGRQINEKLGKDAGNQLKNAIKGLFQ